MFDNWIQLEADLIFYLPGHFLKVRKMDLSSYRPEPLMKFGHTLTRYSPELPKKMLNKMFLFIYKKK